MRADLCPVCEGEGKLYDFRRICHGCSGKGWVEVREEFLETDTDWYANTRDWLDTEWRGGVGAHT